MAHLKTPKQEALARGRADGLPMKEAAALASMSIRWAAKVTKRDAFRSRVAELKRPQLEDLTRQLSEIATSAVAFKSAAGLAAARQALMDIARLHGLGSKGSEERPEGGLARMGWEDEPDMTEAEWFAKYAPTRVERT
ncbi:MAG TPA: hypothetical protein VFE03_15450 [Caulobacteraceae bacterium]|nr:hypothetical protein [Caulobacteraceae bacterium]